jgi:outer membrane usher protein
MNSLRLALSLGLVCFSAVTQANYTFDASTLPIGRDVDISLLNQGTQLPGSYHVEVLINGEQVDSREVLFQLEKQAQGHSRLQPCLSVGLLARYGIKVEAYPGLSANQPKLPEGNCAHLSAIPQATAEFQLHNQQLLLGIPQVALRAKLQGIAPQVLWDDGINVALMNYRATAERTEPRRGAGSDSGSQYFQMGPGANFGPWRLRNSTTWQKSAGQAGHWQSPYTYLERGWYDSKSRLTLGESFTPSDVFDSVPFRGVMLGSDAAMVAHNQREFAPIVRGIARTQARVEVKQNGYTLYNAIVAPGPFALNDLSMNSGSGSDWQVTVWETDGRPQVFTVVHSTPAVAVREGYLKYNLMAGRYSAIGAEQAPVGQATLMYGLPWHLTLFGGLQVADRYHAASLGLGWSLGHWGGMSLGATQAHRQYPDNSESGHSWLLRYSKTMVTTHTTLTLASTQYALAGYSTLANAMARGSADSVNDRRKARTTLTLSQPLGGIGSLNFNGARGSYWGGPRYDESFGASYSVTVKKLSVSLHWTQNKQWDRLGVQQNDRIASLSFSMPLGRGVGGSTTNASYQLTSPSSGGATQEVGLDGNAFKQHLSWDVRQRHRFGLGTGERNNSTLRATWYGSYGQLSANYSYDPAVRQMGMEVAGGVVIHNQGITLSQPLGDTAALVSAPGVSGVAVEGAPGVKTDFRGFTTYAHLAPYQQNAINLDPRRLAHDAELVQTDATVVPTHGAMIPARFATRVGAKALMTLTEGTGQAVPFGALVTQEGQKAAAGVVGFDGKVYLTGLAERGTLVVKWGQTPAQQCRVNYQLPKKSGAAGMHEMQQVCH